MMQYKIAKGASVSELEVVVNTFLEEGWKPTGDLSTHEVGGVTLWCQSLIWRPEYAEGHKKKVNDVKKIAELSEQNFDKWKKEADAHAQGVADGLDIAQAILEGAYKEEADGQEQDKES